VTDNLRWQTAHTYQFCGTTIEYVMNRLGFQEIFIDEKIDSLWKYTGTPFLMDAPQEWVEYTIDHVTEKVCRPLPPIKMVCKFSRKSLLENSKTNFQRHLPDISELQNKYNEPVIILGGGPSVDTEIDRIKKLAKSYPIIAIPRMYQWALKHGLSPDFVLGLDANPIQEESFLEPCLSTKHLIAAVARPALFDKLQNFVCYIWSSMDDPQIKRYQQEAGYTKATVINTGGSVTVAALSVAMFLGFKELHVFGSDCMARDKEKIYATGITGQNVSQVWFEAEVDGDKFYTTHPFLSFARQSIELVEEGKAQGFLKDAVFYGDSLINKLITTSEGE
jgi:hypothetical protein